MSKRRAEPVRRSVTARWVAVGVAAVTAGVYLRLLHAPFLSWDDDRNILLNPAVADGAVWDVWLRPYFGLFVPVTTSIWAGLYALGAGDVELFRIYNLLIHLVNTGLVWKLLKVVIPWGRSESATEAEIDLAALVGTTIFALHPMQTAAVGWISGGRDLTATAFALAAVLVYLSASGTRLVVSTVLFGLALLSKPSVAAVPVALLLCEAVRGRAALRRSLGPMAAWGFLSGLVAALTRTTQTEMTGISVPLAERPLVAADAIGFYLLKLIAPVWLSADYGRTPQVLSEHGSLAVPTIAACVVMLLVIGWRWRRRDGAAAWMGAWIVLFAPVLGLIPFAYQRISTVADHYAYLPMVAVAGLAASIVRQQARRPRVIWGIWLAIAVMSAPAAWERLAVWRTDAEFFGDMVERNPRSFSGLSNLAKGACDGGDLRGGIELSARALALKADNPATLATRAHCLFQAGQLDAVIALRDRLTDPAVQFALDHDDLAAASLFNTFAGAFFERGEPEIGWTHLCQAVAISPANGDLQANVRELTSEFARQGVSVRCPSRLPWAALLSIEPPR